MADVINLAQVRSARLISVPVARTKTGRETQQQRVERLVAQAAERLNGTGRGMALRGPKKERCLDEELRILEGLKELVARLEERAAAEERAKAMARKPKASTITPAGAGPSFAPLIDSIADLWNSLPDEHPMFDGGRELLASMGRDSKGEPL